MIPTAIGLVGFALSGKDSVGAILMARLGYSRGAFADELKREVAAKYGVTVEHIEQNKAVWRDQLVRHGQDRRREDPAYWIDRLQQRGAVVICDCRHLNERRAIESWNGRCFHLKRHGCGPANQEEAHSVLEAAAGLPVIENVEGRPAMAADDIFDLINQ